MTLEQRSTGTSQIGIWNGENMGNLATHAGVNNSYASRIVNLTTLLPDIVAAILHDALLNYLFNPTVDPPAL